MYDREKKTSKSVLARNIRNWEVWLFIVCGALTEVEMWKVEKNACVLEDAAFTPLVAAGGRERVLFLEV